jgi:large subunit ribosomal protein L29
MMAKESTRTKIADLRSKSAEQLKAHLTDLRKEQFNLRIQKATGQLSNVARGRLVRREIAQVQTLLNEQARGIKPKAAGTKAKKAA